jgi:NAD(P)-dependent dehydrogenase (short-subunit alcohol dehydrogenase family)
MFLSCVEGIGMETATALCARRCTVVLAVRDLDKGLEAREHINRKASKLCDGKPIGEIHVMALDLSSILSVVEFAEQFKLKFRRLDILVNNAGLNNEGTTCDGMQQLFQVNYLGHFLLMRLLCGDSRHTCAPPPPRLFLDNLRVVNLSSVCHHTGGTDFEASAFSKYKTSHSYYDDSKLYMNLMTMEFNRRQRQGQGQGQRQGVGSTRLAVSCNPGAVRSSIWRHVPRTISSLFDLVMRIVFLIVEQGCATSVFAATAPLAAFNDRSPAGSAGTDPSIAVEKEGGYCEHPLIPYIVPYSAPFACIGFEMLGPFAGPSFGRVSVPAGAQASARRLWEFSSLLCNQKLNELRTGIELVDDM